jgi:hypothetical protein
VPAYLPSLFRALAASLPRLLIGYATSITIALLARDFGIGHGLPIIAWLGGMQFVLVLSAVFTTLALYYDDELIPTAMLLTLFTAVGGIAGLLIESIVQTRSFFAAMVLAIVAPFSYFVRALLLIPGFAVLVWIARRLRRFLAPDTVPPPHGAA